MALRSKLPDAGVTIFTVMSKLDQDTGAINKDSLTYREVLPKLYYALFRA